MSKKTTYIKTKDYSLSQESFNLEYEANFDMLITTPKPENIGKYYPKDSYISHKDQSKKLIDKLYLLVKKYTLNQKIKYITKFQKNSKTLLDIGTGTGEFLIQAKTKNWKVVGVEPNKLAREKGKNKQIDIHETLDHLNGKKFNIITLWHVLEHLPNLNEEIKKIDSLLEQEGTLIIAVPNFKSYDAKYYKTHWAAYDVPRHLWHFSKNSIEAVFKQHGYKIQEIKPMYFDSYYVSLLSEKYKNGKANYIKAFYRGWLSNYQARTSGEYSSLIYTLKRSKN